MDMNDIDRADTIPDIFEMVKDLIWRKLKKSRAGLELGIVELGNEPEMLLGAYYLTGSNMIVMNETPLKRIQETNPKLLKPYIFSILLHEYIHSLGYFDEEFVKNLTLDICQRTFGDNCMITDLAKDLKQFFPYLIYPSGSPRIESGFRKVKDFDRTSISYIG